MQHIALAFAVFLVLLIGLSFGERISAEVISWLSYLTGLAFHNFQDILHTLQSYIRQNWGKVVLALLLTLPISYWLSRKSQPAEGQIGKYSKRKTALFLAIFLGWAGIHRFYLGQIGWGLVYLILFYLFAPLSVIISWIDAIRYLIMSDDEFVLR